MAKVPEIHVSEDGVRSLCGLSLLKGFIWTYPRKGGTCPECLAKGRKSGEVSQEASMAVAMPASAAA